jgi:hypothetical protein
LVEIHAYHHAISLLREPTFIHFYPGLRYIKIICKNKVYAVYNNALLLKYLTLQNIYTPVFQKSLNICKSLWKQQIYQRFFQCPFRSLLLSPVPSQLSPFLEKMRTRHKIQFFQPDLQFCVHQVGSHSVPGLAFRAGQLCAIRSTAGRRDSERKMRRGEGKVVCS